MSPVDVPVVHSKLLASVSFYVFELGRARDCVFLAVFCIVSCSHEFSLSAMDSGTVSKVLVVCCAGLCNPWNKRRYTFLTFLMISESDYTEGE